MRRDPVRANYFENTGSYLWQVAARMIGDACEQEVPAELSRPTPPVVQDPFRVWPHVLAPTAMTQWSSGVQRVDGVRTPLLTRRGGSVTLAVSAVTEAFVEVSAATADALAAGAVIASLPAVTEYSGGADAGDVVAALARHGLVTISDQSAVVPWGVRREPFATTSEDSDGVIVVTNLLNGRFLRVSEPTAAVIDALRTPMELTEPVVGPLRTLVEAGVLRIIGEP